MEERFNLSLFYRRLILLLIDTHIILFSIWFSNTLLYSSNNRYEQIPNLLFCLIAIFLSLPIYLLTGQYKGLTRYASTSVLYIAAIRNFTIILVFFGISRLTPILNLPTNYLILLWFVLTTLNGGSRILMRDLLTKLTLKKNKFIKSNVVIYGITESAVLLSRDINFRKKNNVIAFIDDKEENFQREISGIKIYPFESIKDLAANNRIQEVFIALPSLNKEKLRKIVSRIREMNLKVFEIPSIEKINKDPLNPITYKPIQMEALLGRDPVPPDMSLLGKDLKDKNICITGAGGSIGSELSRQLLKCNPKSLVLIENSEYNLYQITQELSLLNFGKKTILKSILGSCTNEKLVKKLFIENNIEITFHAAAYKHVPLVENNPLVAIKNNVFSTLTICSVANKFYNQKVILISTDKAVRPTSIMGATKRLSELIVQDYSNRALKNGNNKNCFAMVRFGNVLGSSGSVVPLFKKQISQGGPITITDPEMIRYFMTIPEASQLVIQASSLAIGGEVFILEMGEQVRLMNLAKQMIKLSGLTLKNENNRDGDIEIKIIGARPGEKLYEELLIDNNSKPTKHPRIFKARENSISHEKLLNGIENLKKALNNYDENFAKETLRNLVPEWKKKEIFK